MDIRRSYRWKSAYLQEGVLAFDLDTVRIIRNVRDVYSTRYINYLEGVMAAYPPDSPIHNVAAGLLDKVQLSIRLIGKLLAEGGVRATKSELKKMFDLTKTIAKDMKELSKALGQDPKYKDEIMGLEEGLLSPSDMAKSQKLIHERLKKVPKSPSLIRGVVRATAAGFFGLLGGLVSGPIRKAMYDILGYSGAALVTGLLRAPVRFARVLGGSISGPMRRRRETQLQEFLSAGRMGTGAMRRLGVPSAAGLVGGLGEELMPSGIIPSGVGLGAFRARTRRQKEEATEPLFYFFDKRAYRARWTRELLQATKVGGRGRVVGGVESADFLDSLFGGAIGAALSGTLRNPLKTLGYVIAGITGTQIIKAIMDRLLGPSPEEKRTGVPVGTSGEVKKAVRDFLEEHPRIKTWIASGITGAILSLTTKTGRAFLKRQAIKAAPKLVPIASKVLWPLSIALTGIGLGELIYTTSYRRGWVEPSPDDKGFLGSLLELYQLRREFSEALEESAAALPPVPFAAMPPVRYKSVPYEELIERRVEREPGHFVMPTVMGVPYNRVVEYIKRTAESNEQILEATKERNVSSVDEPNFQDPNLSPYLEWLNAGYVPASWDQ